MGTAPPADAGPATVAAPAATAVETTPAAAAEPAPVEEPAQLGIEGDQDEGSDVGDWSLADLAGLDVSDVEEIRPERLPAMAGVFRGTAASLGEQDNRDGERRIVATVTFEVAEVTTIVEKGYTPEDTLGKKHTERFWIVPEKAQEGIGRIRAFVADIGLDNRGALGGLEGVAPGILDSIVGHTFPAKITTRKQDGETYARMKLPARKKPQA